MQGVAERGGARSARPAAGSRLFTDARSTGPPEGYYAFHATHADLLRRLGRSEESRAAYDRAIRLAGNTAEMAYLIRRRGQLAGP